MTEQISSSNNIQTKPLTAQLQKDLYQIINTYINPDTPAMSETCNKIEKIIQSIEQFIYPELNPAGANIELSPSAINQLILDLPKNYRSTVIRILCYHNKIATFTSAQEQKIQSLIQDLHDKSLQDNQFDIWLQLTDAEKINAQLNTLPLEQPNVLAKFMHDYITNNPGLSDLDILTKDLIWHIGFSKPNAQVQTMATTLQVLSALAKQQSSKMVYDQLLTMITQMVFQLQVLDTANQVTAVQQILDCLLKTCKTQSELTGAINNMASYIQLFNQSQHNILLKTIMHYTNSRTPIQFCAKNSSFRQYKKQRDQWVQTVQDILIANELDPGLKSMITTCKQLFCILPKKPYPHEVYDTTRKFMEQITTHKDLQVQDFAIEEILSQINNLVALKQARVLHAMMECACPLYQTNMNKGIHLIETIFHSQYLTQQKQWQDTLRELMRLNSDGTHNVELNTLIKLFPQAIEYQSKSTKSATKNKRPRPRPRPLLTPSKKQNRVPSQNAQSNDQFSQIPATIYLQSDTDILNDSYGLTQPSQNNLHIPPLPLDTNVPNNTNILNNSHGPTSSSQDDWESLPSIVREDDPSDILLSDMPVRTYWQSNTDIFNDSHELTPSYQDDQRPLSPTIQEEWQSNYPPAIEEPNNHPFFQTLTTTDLQPNTQMFNDSFVSMELFNDPFEDEQSQLMPPPKKIRTLHTYTPPLNLQNSIRSSQTQNNINVPPPPTQNTNTSSSLPHFPISRPLCDKKHGIKCPGSNA